MNAREDEEPAADKSEPEEPEKTEEPAPEPPAAPAPEAAAAPPRRAISPRVALIAGVAVAVIVAVALGLTVFAPKRGVAGLPPPIAFDAASLPTVPPPQPVGSPAEIADVDDLVARQEHRTDAQKQQAEFWQKGAVLQWNEVTIGLIAKYNTSPVVASRALALVSVAQHDALIAVTRAQRQYKRPAPARVTPLFAASGESTYPSDHAAVAAASAAVLSFLYSSKQQVELLAQKAEEHQQSRIIAGVSRRSDVEAGAQIGAEVAKKIIAAAKTDGAAQAGVNWQGTVPTGKGKWASSEHPPVIPLRVKWGAVRPWLMKSGDQFRPPPPPEPGSPEFNTALDEVRKISKGRTPEQLRVALLWGDSPGTPTPPGHWNRIAAELLAKHPLSELEEARIMALLNMAVMDAGISCWETKYHYWFFRPTQADPTITIPVGLPNFPSYTSGHSTFSGAAAVVLGHFFPAEKERFMTMADEASMSRVYDGIHYRFDAEQGLAAGKKIGQLAVDKARGELTP